MEGDRRGFKGVWLCAAIYESQELSPVEKLLLAEIDALTSDANACYASNAHFSNRLGITVTRVDHLLGKLTRLGYTDSKVALRDAVTRPSKRLSSWEFLNLAEKDRTLKAELDRQRAKVQMEQQEKAYER